MYYNRFCVCKSQERVTLEKGDLFKESGVVEVRDGEKLWIGILTQFGTMGYTVMGSVTETGRFFPVTGERYVTPPNIDSENMEDYLNKKPIIYSLNVSPGFYKVRLRCVTEFTIDADCSGAVYLSNNDFEAPVEYDSPEFWEFGAL